MRTFSALFVTLGIFCARLTLQGQVFLTFGTQGTVGEYNFDGSPINPSLISGLGLAFGIVIVGDNLFVTDSGNGTVGEYTLGGSPVNPALITGLVRPGAIAYSDGHLFIASSPLAGGGSIGEYTISGQMVNSSLIAGLSSPAGIAISGNTLYVANFNGGNPGGSVGEYTTSGQTLNASFISNVAAPFSLAVDASNLYVSNLGLGAHPNDGYVGKFTLSGGSSFPHLIDSLRPRGIAVWGDKLYVIATATSGLGPDFLAEYSTDGTFFGEQAGFTGARNVAVVPEPTVNVLIAVFAVLFAFTFWTRRTVW